MGKSRSQSEQKLPDDLRDIVDIAHSHGVKVGLITNGHVVFDEITPPTIRHQNENRYTALQAKVAALQLPLTGEVSGHVLVLLASSPVIVAFIRSARDIICTLLNNNAKLKNEKQITERVIESTRLRLLVSNGRRNTNIADPSTNIDNVIRNYKEDAMKDEEYDVW